MGTLTARPPLPATAAVLSPVLPSMPALNCCCTANVRRYNAGKVHGSLARAGKVRGQTPKVAKADKKKNPKGRAAQRIKYNRRFVNVGTQLV